MEVEMGIGSVSNRIDFKSEYAYIGVVCAMISEAQSLNVSSGVAVFLVEKRRPDGISQPHYEAVNRSFYDGRGNYLASAMAMIATMKALQAPTGENQDPSRLLKWESSRRGGLLKKVDGYCIYVAFDGDCHEERNLEIATLGMAMMFPK